MAGVAAMCIASAATPMQTLLQVLPKEAADFSRCASQLYTKETLIHRDPADGPEPRNLISEYTFVQTRDAAGAIREVRQMRELNGKPLKAASSLESIAQALSDGSEKQRRRQLERFEKLGIYGAATDLGQMLLMFSAASLAGYEFRATGDETSAEGTRMAAFSFTPIDTTDSKGPLVFAPGKQVGQKPRFKGTIWLRIFDWRLARIAMDSEAMDGRVQRLSVDYEPSDACPCVMPTVAKHKEVGADGAVLVENEYVYERFRPLSEKK